MRHVKKLSKIRQGNSIFTKSWSRKFIPCIMTLKMLIKSNLYMGTARTTHILRIEGRNFQGAVQMLDIYIGVFYLLSL